MPFTMTTATVTLAVLSVMNLAILLAAVRRLNQLADRGQAGGSGIVQEDSPLPAPGAKVGDFATLTVDGEPMGRADLAGRMLVGFFATGCPPCEAFAPEFVAHANAFPGGRQRVLAVIVDKRGGPSELADRLGQVARVIVEPVWGPASTAFGIDGFPAACLLEDNVVLAAEFDLEALSLRVPVSPLA